MTVLALCFPASGWAQDRAVPTSQEQVQLSFAPVVKQVAPAVVNIYTKRTVVKRVSPFSHDPFFSRFFQDDMFGRRMRRQVESALGSGVIVQPDGLVVTNAHVVRGAEEITVVLVDGREFDAELSLSDDASDLALLRITPDEEGIPYVSLGPSESLEVGDIVLAIGNPFSVGQTVTSGIVSARGSSALDINDYNFFIQTDAAINPGNSGGPLVALDGGVVGINTAIYSRDGGSLGIGFAIPSEMVASVIAAEKLGGDNAQGIVRPWLGVTAQRVSQDIASSMNLERPSGALISRLHSASPLIDAGMKVGDVVLSVNGRAVRDPSEMKFRMATVPIGRKAQVEAMRGGKAMGFEVAAIAAPDKPPRNATVLEGQHPLSGITIGHMNPAVAVELGLVGDREEGVVVLDVPRGNLARRIVQEADIILEINGREVETVSDVQKAVKDLSAGFSMTVRSHGRARQIVIR